ncbi:hypothetical protein [Streptomyces fractus]|uniref:hypothetical protein n=1 Tax=Streptomyces fractus TaxID=641806 RepID=UPI003CF02353
MEAQIVQKATFLLHEIRLSPQDSVARLKSYYPALDLTERVAYVHEAYHLLCHTSTVERPPVSSLASPSSFAAGREHHALTD